MIGDSITGSYYELMDALESVNQAEKKKVRKPRRKLDMVRMCETFFGLDEGGER